MNSLVRIAKLTPAMSVGRRGLQTGMVKFSSTKPDIQRFDPNNYNIPIRHPTMDDLMEPYGLWKQAYEAERKAGNRTLIMGILCFTATCTLFVYSGVLEGIIMPNLDNIMEDTEPLEPVDRDERVSV